MSFIYLNERHDRLKEYSAVTKGAKSIVTVKIECGEPGSLGYLLESLGEIEREQLARDKAARDAARKAAKKAPLALPAPHLQLPYYGGEE